MGAAPRAGGPHEGDSSDVHQCAAAYSRQQTIRELGYDPMIVMDEIAEDNDLADEKG
ncbi:MAG: hypothetical protein ACLUI3_15350 [Christensenellales bacterium]